MSAKKVFVQIQTGRTFAVLVSDMASEAIGSGLAIITIGYRTKCVWHTLDGRKHRYYAIPALARMVDVLLPY